MNDILRIRKYSDLTLIPEEGNGEIGFQNGELVSRLSQTEDASDEELVTRDIPTGEFEAHVAFTGTPENIAEEEETDSERLVTDEPVVSGYVAIQEYIPDTHEEHDQ